MTHNYQNKPVSTKPDYQKPADSTTNHDEKTVASLKFSERLKLSEDFEVWCRENCVSTAPLAVITYLHYQGFLDVVKIKEARSK